jgi:hypothetical protein
LLLNYPYKSGFRFGKVAAGLRESDGLGLEKLESLPSFVGLVPFSSNGIRSLLELDIIRDLDFNWYYL